MIDIFDPNNWPLLPPHEHRIYGDDHARTWCLVDEDDYHFLIQWRWSWTSPNSPGAKRQRNSTKLYLRRNVQTTLEPATTPRGVWINPEGKSGREVEFKSPRIQQTLRMHTVIMLRSGIVPPSPDHTIPDHIDGNERDCRRANLRWATVAMNNRNKFGKAAKEMSDDEAR